MPEDGVRVMVFTDVDSATRFKLFDPEVFPLGDLLISASRDNEDVTAPADVSVNLDLQGDLLTGAVLEDLLGVCLGAEFLLDVDAYALAN
jgi:hypothetical protein